MMAAKMIFFSFLLFAFIGSSLQVKNLNVTIYYDGSSEESRNMFVSSILPGYQQHSENGEVDFDFNLIPYGVSGNTHELLANKVQACIFSQDKPTVNKVEFLKCALRQPSPWDIFYVKICINYWGFNFAKVRDCYEGPEGDELHKINEEKTSAIVPSLAEKTPVIIFDGKYDAAVSDMAQRFFFSEVCAYFDHQLTECPRF